MLFEAMTGRLPFVGSPDEVMIAKRTQPATRRRRWSTACRRTWSACASPSWTETRPGDRRAAR